MDANQYNILQQYQSAQRAAFIGIPQYDAILQHLGLAPLPLVATSPPLVLEKAFLVGPLIGYRAWQVKDGLLVSVNHGAPVTPGRPAVAECAVARPIGHPEHAAPWAACSCGLYAYKSPRRCLTEQQNAAYVYGQVALWGKVIEHAEGWRAQYAYPLALWVPRSPMPGFPMGESGVLKLAERYGIRTIAMPAP